MRIRREYQSWVANETLEDYALRYAARSYRRWTPFTLANTALGGASFLALEAIGASVTLSFGFQNAFPAILLACLLIFLVGLPVAYHASTANVDIDLLTRGAGFGYAGSTVTSLIYASFTFIFFALESAILAQALALATGLDLTLGYLICSLAIVPLVFFGVTLINRLQMWTQPLWAVLLVLPFAYILGHDPHVFSQWAAFTGLSGGTARFDLLAFGAATGVLFSLMGQIGEQVDYLRFLPDRSRANRRAWWSALLLAGPGWILIGGLKVMAGSLLAVLALNAGIHSRQAMEPIHMYLWAYGQVFDRPEVVLGVALLFVLVSQIKINVTNAYAGSLAWSNVFVRLAHYHPGRVVWLVFNVVIALLLTLLGIFATLEAVLSVYAIVVTAWLGALVADLVVLKPLGISPRHVEFRRAYLHAFNPVGCGAMLAASLAGLGAYAGLFGATARAYAAFLALAASFCCAVAIAYATGGRYYIARDNSRFRAHRADEPIRCCVCERDYEAPDMAHCPFYGGPICSLCCGLDNHCHDACKRPADAPARAHRAGPAGMLAPRFTGRLARFLALFLTAAAAMGALFLLAWRLMDGAAASSATPFAELLLRVYAATLPLLAFGAWWIVLSHESRELARAELLESLRHLESARKHLVESEKMASLGGLVAGVAHEINTPVGIAVSAASYLQDRTDAVLARQARGELQPGELERYLEDAAQSARLLLSNANRAAQLVQSFKQVAVDQASEKRRRFDLGDYLRETATSLRPGLRDTRVRLLVDCPAGIVMDSYPGPIAQILTNLVMNSLQHGFGDGRAGTIRIAARHDEDDGIALSHADDGCGIPRALHEKIFEPFYTSRRGQGGSGLGLHLVYNLVTQRLGGTIAVAERAGGGVEFTVRMPRVTPSARATIPIVPAGNPT
ncbi:histidine kinase [Cupriavidus sp. USMAHM13]|uniref:ATP-binding protein n=1 Tax=Cupriavidus sp. USMAHM13 TaxID=1389192 RepID=UPI0008A6691B|nr:ATP-binding protein [Cupriavidus sp. USMAHM13]AOZ02737.1 histidine kinase [Cupriavidus sp. USMAHM13]